MSRENNIFENRSKNIENYSYENYLKTDVPTKKIRKSSHYKL